MLRLTSYNIRKAVGLDWRRKPERILDVLSETGAQVAVLQEADRRFGRRHAAVPDTMIQAAGWQVAPLSRQPGGIAWHGNAVLVRGGVEVAEARRIGLAGLEPRGAAIVDLTCGLRVAGVHLGLTPGWRRRQISQVLEELARLDDMPTIIAGDFNEWRASNVTLAALTTHFDLVVPGPSFHASRPTAELDLFALGQGLRVAATGVHDSPLARRASDHLPIWIDLSLAPETAALS